MIWCEKKRQANAQVIKHGVMFYGFGEASSAEALEKGGKSQEWWTLIEEEKMQKKAGGG
jgi:hypothetical protein